jgi:site-specific DNA-cytosine methylase
MTTALTDLIRAAVGSGKHEMRTAHLCCGRGGSLWTGAILGWQNILAFDHDEWRCKAVAADGWPGLTTVCGDIDGFPWDSFAVGRVDCIAAGFSCRDISAAGGRAGLDGKSTGPTWQGCLQAIDAFRPAWVFFENSPRIKPYRPTIWQAMRDRGYYPRDGTLDAAEVGAPHKRRRWFMLCKKADVAGERWSEGRPKWAWQQGGLETAGMGGAEARPNANSLRELQPQGRQRDEWGRPGDVVQEDPADSMCDGLQEPLQCWGLSEAGRAAIQAAKRYCGAYYWNPTDAGLLRVVDGLADRGKRIAALGDAWVPLQAAAAWCLLGGPIGAKKTALTNTSDAVS